MQRSNRPFTSVCRPSLPILLNDRSIARKLRQNGNADTMCVVPRDVIRLLDMLRILRPSPGPARGSGEKLISFKEMGTVIVFGRSREVEQLLKALQNSPNFSIPYLVAQQALRKCAADCRRSAHYSADPEVPVWNCSAEDA